MRGVLIGILGLFRRFRLGWRKLIGKTEADLAAEAVVSGKAWEEFCDTLKAAGGALQFPGAPQDPKIQAEGYRYLSRLARGGLEAFLEYGDTLAPELKRLCHETVKLGADNPDNYYQNCNLDGAYTYKITGTRGSVTYLGFSTKAGQYGQQGGITPLSELDASVMDIADDGTFEILISKEKHSGNWLEIHDGPNMLFVRQTFADREKEQIAELKIERLTGPKDPSSELTPERLVEALRAAGTFAAGAPIMFANWSNGFRKHSNKLPRFSDEVSTKAGGDPNIAYYHSHWALGPDEALVIEVMPPACDFWNFQLNNYWMESLDYVRHPVHTNSHIATYKSDGSVMVIVSATDPGIPDATWLSTTGHSEGTMCWRWVGAKEEDKIEPPTRIVKLSSLTPATT